MIRKGRFALWKSKEYELISYQRQYYLQSKNQSDLQSGFKEIPGNASVFVKKISVKELEDAYEIIPFVMISGHRFAVEGYNINTGIVALVTNNPFVQKKIDVKPYGKYEYIIEISHEDICIIEDRISILGFENTYYWKTSLLSGKFFC